MAIVTWDPNNKGSNITLSSDNYTVTINTINQGIRTTVGKSYGKWYWEVTNVSGESAKFIGIASSTVSMSNGVASNANVRLYYGYNGTKNPGGKSYGASYTNGDIISVLVDLDNGTLEFWKNGVSQGISHTDIKTLGTIYPICTVGTSGGNIVYYANFGQTSFSYTPPVGFLPYGNNTLILIEKENNILTYNSSNASWEIISTSNSLNKDLFVNYGLGEYELSYASNTVLELSNFEILIWNEAGTDLNEITMNAIPKPQLVKQVENVEFNGELQSFALDVTQEDVYTDNLIPTMTSNTTPSGEVSASGYNSTYYPYKAFDGIKNNDNNMFMFNAVQGWLQYKFPFPRKIIKYGVTGHHNATWVSQSPKDWTFEASNDGVNWVILDTVTNQTGWGAAETRYFTINNDSYYLYYRINVTANNSGSSNYGTAISELEMMKKISEPTFKIIVSNDNGETWRSFKNNAWINVDISDLSNVKKNGMISAEFNSLNQSQWEELGLYNNNIRFAYYLEQNNSNEVLEVNSLTAVSKITTITPTVSSITINYSELDKRYSGLMFMDTSQQYYSTSIGEIIKYLDFNTLIAGQTSLDIKVILTNTYPFDVQNIRLFTETNIQGLTVELSKSNNPFIPESQLVYNQRLNFDETIEFYVRLSVSETAIGSGTFDIKVEADPV
jgi:hypothetical protein